MNDAQSAFDELWTYCTANDRVVPAPKRWSDLYHMLKNTRLVNSAGGREPPLPSILAAWWCTSDTRKQEIFKEHIRWAQKHDQLAEVGAFLRGLPESEWHLRMPLNRDVSGAPSQDDFLND